MPLWAAGDIMHAYACPDCGALFGNPHMSETRATRCDECRGPYMIKRFVFRATGRSRTIARGLTLAEARAHCSDPETSSSTCTKAAGKRRTAAIGPWFDGYTREGDQ